MVSAGNSYLVAIRYDVEPEIVRLGESAAVEAMRFDFKRAAELGFDAVVLQHLDPREEPTVLGLAVDANLTPLVPSRPVQHYVLTGTLPPGFDNSAELVARHLAGYITTPSGRLPFVYSGACEVCNTRAQEVVESAGKRGVRCLAVGDSGEHGDSDSLAVIRAAVESSQDGGSPIEWWLAQYHQGLLSGRTAGVVIDRYRRPPGDPPGLVSQGTSVPLARAAALRMLVTRALRWAPHVHRTIVERMDVSIFGSGELHVVGLVRGMRRHLLVVNPSMDRYARGRVSLPESIGGKKPTRAVEVPPSKSRPAGRVFHSVRGKIELSVALRPGDAALFELF